MCCAIETAKPCQPPSPGLNNTVPLLPDASFAAGRKYTFCWCPRMVTWFNSGRSSAAAIAGRKNRITAELGHFKFISLLFRPLDFLITAKCGYLGQRQCHARQIKRVAVDH